MADPKPQNTEPAKLNVLLVEDDPSVVTAVREGLAQLRVNLHHAPTIADGMRALERPRFYDAVVLDLNLPDGHGFEIADACRRSDNDIPIVMVTARDTVNERIAGLGHGADDYLCKPFAIEELIARLDAVLRRALPKQRHILTYSDVKLDLVRREVRRNGVEKTLSARELDLLAYLMCHPEQVLTQEQILRDVWGDEAEHDSNVLRVYANYLRNKLERPRLIHTVRGVGYVLSEREPNALRADDLPPG